MKTIITSMFISLSLFLSAQSISFDKEIIDYGSIKKGANGQRIFKVTNTGNKPLIISNVKSSCDCSISAWTKTPILPGKAGEISVTYDTKINGKFLKSIEVYSNDPKSSRKIVKIKGEVL